MTAKKPGGASYNLNIGALPCAGGKKAGGEGDGPRSIHVISSLRISAGGPTVSVVQLCLALNRLGAPAEIVTLEDWDSVPLPQGLQIRYFPKDRPRWLRRSRALAEYLTHAKYDLVHVHGLWEWTGVHARCAARRYGRPLVISPRGMLEPWSLSNRAWRKRVAMTFWERANLKYAGMLHATAESEANHLVELGFDQPIAIVPNGIAFPDSPRRKCSAKRKVLFLSRLHPVKGVDLLLKAWSQIDSKKRFGWALELVGPDEKGYRKKLEGIVLARKESNFVKILGPKYGDDKWKAIREADLLVLPSMSENFGIVVVEALSQGVPVIATQGTPWKELVNRGCGWWVKPNVAELKRALEEAITVEPKVLAAMGQIGQKWVREVFTPEAVASELIKHYRKLVTPA